MKDILHHPWPRILVDEAEWGLAANGLAAGEATLLALWGEPWMVHLAALGPDKTPVILSLACRNGRFPSIGALHPAAIRPERAIQDMTGLVAAGLPDGRPWLDHGVWQDGAAEPAFYPFLPAEGAGLHQIPVGPVHAGTIEPGHFRITVNGDAVVRLETRLGYAHKGTMALMRGAAIPHAARLAGRISGDSTVAYALVFARAVEAAHGVEAPPRAQALRGIMAELERLANHFGDVGAICNDGGFALINAHCAALREQVLRLAASCFGHRLMMDKVVPGGVAAEPAADGLARIGESLAGLRLRFGDLAELYDKTASLQDRVVGAGRLDPVLAARLGCGGYVGRASGRDFDARRDLPYPPYDRLSFTVPVLQAGDVDARVRVRIREIAESLDLVGQLLESLPPGPLRNEIHEASSSTEGSAIVEGFRGDIYGFVRCAEGRVESAYLRDPSWFNWLAIEAAIEGNIVADFPLCNKSFNCAYSGHDL